MHTFDRKTKQLSRLFEKKDAPKTAQSLVSMARAGIPTPMAAFFGHPLEDEWLDFAAQALRDWFQRRKGCVYVVANPVNKGMYKIGMTSDDLNKRLRSLKTAGVVGEFFEVDQALALDRFVAEKMAQKSLSVVAQRHKEFFVTDWRTACRALQHGVKSDNDILTKAFGAWFVGTDVLRMAACHQETGT